MKRYPQAILTKLCKAYNAGSGGDLPDRVLESLHKQTGLTRVQIARWFANRRFRESLTGRRTPRRKNKRIRPDPLPAAAKDASSTTVVGDVVVESPAPAPSEPETLTLGRLDWGDIVPLFGSSDVLMCA